MAQGKGWIGVDLDGTLAHYDHWRGVDHIGEPVPTMLERVKRWRADGRDVRIFTARVSSVADETDARTRIADWCKKHIGEILPVTCVKDSRMVELWDDRAVQVLPNTGMPACYIADADDACPCCGGSGHRGTVREVVDTGKMTITYVSDSAADIERELERMHDDARAVVSARLRTFAAYQGIAFATLMYDAWTVAEAMADERKKRRAKLEAAHAGG